MAFSPIRPVTTGTYTTNRSVTPSIADTVDDLRNEIRAAVGRHERVESTAFTKEALAAICEAVGHDIGEGGLPCKARMRAGVLGEVGELPADDRKLSEMGVEGFSMTEEATLDVATGESARLRRYASSYPYDDVEVPVTEDATHTVEGGELRFESLLAL